jgi:F0F1-type ATP synthase assembly protein I
MKRLLLIVATLGVLGSCAPKKYSYNFDRHNYYAGKKASALEKADENIVAAETATVKEDLVVTSDELVATSTKETTITEKQALKNNLLEKSRELSKKQEALKNATTPKEIKTLRKEMKTELKELKKDVRTYLKSSPQATEDTQAMDKNLKIGLIFLLAGVIVGIVFGPLGFLLSVIGVVFLILWLIEQ